MGRGVERGLEGDVSQCGASDAEDDEVFVFVGFFGEWFDGAHMLGSHGLAPELSPSFPSGAVGLGEVGGDGFDSFSGGGSWGDSGFVEPVGTDAGGEHVGVFDGEHVDSVCRGLGCGTIGGW